MYTCLCWGAGVGGEKAQQHATDSQNEALYSQQGQHNPHAARAERKRAKKEAKGARISGLAADALAGLSMRLKDGAQDGSDDYDFKEAFAGHEDVEQIREEEDGSSDSQVEEQSGDAGAELSDEDSSQDAPSEGGLPAITLDGDAEMS